jgi:polyhydroxybutyrate depolymerase
MMAGKFSSSVTTALLFGIAALWFTACGSMGAGNASPGSGGSPSGAGGRGGSPAAGSGGGSGADATGGSAAGIGGSAGAVGDGGAVAGTGGGPAGTTGRGGAGGGGAGNGGRGGAAGTGPTGTGGASAGTGGAGTGVAGSSGRSGATGSAGRGGTAGNAAGAGGGAAGAPCPSTAMATPGETNKSIMVGTLMRTYLLHIPTGYTGKAPVPVVLDFHGLGGSGSSQKALSGWATLGDSKGFITVFPNGVGNSWNIGRCCSTAQTQNVDDVGFVRAIIKQLQTDACIDSKRVYASGCSNGGGMSYKLACDAADVIAAVAPVDCDCVTGSTSNPSCASCSPVRPISEIAFRATGDQVVPYNGGRCSIAADCRPGMSCMNFDFPGAATNFSTWATIDQCTGSAQALSAHPACQTSSTCGGGAEVTLCTQQGGSHCGNYASLGIVSIAWEMFQKEALP